MTQRLFLGDFGTTIEITVTENGVPVDISAANSVQVILKSPSGSSYHVANFSSDGTDGKIAYTLQDGDIDRVGAWHLQGYIETPSGQWHTETATFMVVAPLMPAVHIGGIGLDPGLL